MFLNTDKTKIRLVGIGTKLNHVQCDSFSVKINECELENVVKYKCLGVLVDNELNWHKNVDNVIQKFFCKIALLRRLNPYLDVDILYVLYKALVQPHFDYCSVAWYGRFKEDCRLIITPL